METDAARLDPAQRFFDACPEMLCVLDREGRVVRANRAWIAVMGARREEERLLDRATDSAQARWLRDGLRRTVPTTWSGELRTAAGSPERFHLSWGPDGEGLLHAVARAIGREQGAQQDSHQRDLLRAVLDNTPVVIWVIDRDGRFTVSAGRALHHFGLEEGQVVGWSIDEVYREKPDTLRRVREALAGASMSYRTEVVGRSWDSHLSPIRDGEGEVTGLLGVSFDVTEQTRLEREMREHIAVLEQQRDTIRALSTPILQVWDGVLTLPLMGFVDGARAEALMDALLAEIARTGARYAILDVTGVATLDTATVRHLARLLGAIRLLGAEGILTGVRPAVAQSLVAAAAELPDVPTLRNLQAGLRRCLMAQRDARR